MPHQMGLPAPAQTSESTSDVEEAIVIARIAMGHSRDKQFPLAAHGYVRGSAGDATEVARADMGTG